MLISPSREPPHESNSPSLPPTAFVPPGERSITINPWDELIRRFPTPTFGGTLKTPNSPTQFMANLAFQKAHNWKKFWEKKPFEKFEPPGSLNL